NATSVGVGDFNGDDKPDLAVAKSCSAPGPVLAYLGTVGVLLNTCCTNATPVVHSQTLSVEEDSNLAITLSASDADNDSLIYRVTSPIHGKLSGTPPNLVYRPALHYFGPD